MGVRLHAKVKTEPSSPLFIRQLSR